jgi:hypothetical protein
MEEKGTAGQGPQGYTITIPDAGDIRIFINVEDAKALREMGKKLAVIDAVEPLALGGSVYIECPTE